ncbi:DUF3626 domain-containing protein [Actinoplanes aureus]|uniref:DUF3626 domain-containing protein n=1 Tax=Actinoplanes aureus TaxID=2792083 RepID=A0A931G554_9ACTN|nr:DUF3626 domain-containing protein [Actinoplanes aureus]MBG0565919.1 DUF3626 domain-containing protein [Actinoplanes aureus]
MTAAAERALAHVRALFPSPGGFPVPAAVTVNFHPDRLAADGRTVAECLAADGVYRNQFETRISNGGLNAHLGGARESWEHRMFGGAYTGPTGRPVYGALNLAGHPDGAAPRFGSCHLVLTPRVAARSTFSHGDSVTEPTVLGTSGTFAAVWAALLGEVTRTGSALGVAAASPPQWAAELATRAAAYAAWPAEPGPPPVPAGRSLDAYIEAQVHGGLPLDGNVTAVVADPSFRGTSTEASLARLGVPIRWHHGFRLPAGDFPADLRGPAVPPLARLVADRYQRPVLDAEVIGRAARSVVRSPHEWSRFDDPLQQIKYLWHILVLRG